MTGETRTIFVLSVLVLAAYVLFVAFYALRSSWSRGAIGRSLMFSKATVVLLLAHVLIVLGVGNYTGRPYVWAILLALACLSESIQVVILLREQRRINNGDHPRRRTSDRTENNRVS